MSDKFRAVFDPAIGVCDSLYESEIVGSYETANLMLDTIAKYTLFLHDQGLMFDHSNIGWIEQQVDGNWVSLEDDT